MSELVSQASEATLTCLTTGCFLRRTLEIRWKPRQEVHYLNVAWQQSSREKRSGHNQFISTLAAVISGGFSPAFGVRGAADSRRTYWQRGDGGGEKLHGSIQPAARCPLSSPLLCSELVANMSEGFFSIIPWHQVRVHSVLGMDALHPRRRAACRLNICHSARALMSS